MGDDFQIECPTGSGNRMNLYQVAEEISKRLSSIFQKDNSGKRPVNTLYPKFQEDPHWKDYILFYEYYHGDSGRGVGANHQTGWSGVIARTMKMFAEMSEVDTHNLSKKEVLGNKNLETAQQTN